MSAAFQNEISVAGPKSDRLGIHPVPRDKPGEEQLAAFSLRMAEKRAQEEKRAADLAKQVREERERERDAISSQTASLSRQNEIQQAKMAGNESLVRTLETESKIRDSISEAEEKRHPKLVAAMREQITLEAELSAKMDERKNRMSEMRNVGEALGGTLIRGFVEGRREGERLADTIVNIGNRIQDILLEQALYKPFENAVGNLFAGGGVSQPTNGGSGIIGGIGNFISGLFSRNGNAFSGGNVQMMRDGGILSGPTAFGYSGGVAVGGEVAHEDEAIIPLRRGPNGKLGVQNFGGGGGGQTLKVEIINQSGEKMTVRQGQQRNNGNELIQELIVDVVTSTMADGAYDELLASKVPSAGNVPGAF